MSREKKSSDISRFLTAEAKQRANKKQHKGSAAGLMDDDDEADGASLAAGEFQGKLLAQRNADRCSAGVMEPFTFAARVSMTCNHISILLLTYPFPLRRALRSLAPE